MMTTRNTKSIVSLFAFALGFCVLGFASQAMALPITIEGSAGSSPITSSSTGTIPGFTVGSNDNRALVVTIGGEAVPGVSSVSFGSQSFTQAGTAIFSSNTTASVWYLLNPASATDTITVNLTGSGGGWAFGAVSLSNVAQQAPITATFSAGDSANPSVSLNTLTPNSLVVEALGRNETGTNTPLSGQIAFFSSLVLSGGAGTIGSTDFIPLAGLTTQSWNLTGSNRTPLVAAAFAPFIAPAPEPASVVLLGLGLVGLVTQRRRNRAPQAIA